MSLVGPVGAVGFVAAMGSVGPVRPVSPMDHVRGSSGFSECCASVVLSESRASCGIIGVGEFNGVSGSSGLSGISWAHCVQ